MPEPERSRPTPEQLLKQVEAEERHQRHGKLKVFLGYASGVGKSFRMLDEGRRRKARGQDVVVAAVQTSFRFVLHWSCLPALVLLCMDGRSILVACALSLSGDFLCMSTT